MSVSELAAVRKQFADNVAEYRQLRRWDGSGNSTYKPSPPCDINDVPEWYPDCLKTYLTEISLDIFQYEHASFMDKHIYVVNKPVFDKDKLDREIREIGLERYYTTALHGVYKDKYDSKFSLEHVHKCYLEIKKMYYESIELLSLGCSTAIIWYTETNTVKMENGDDIWMYGIVSEYLNILRSRESLESFLGFS